MAEEVPAAAAPAKAPRSRPPRPKPDGPTVGELIIRAVSACRERSGMSFSAIRSGLAAIGYDVEKNNSRIKVVVKSLVRKGILLQITGTGASGSYKINREMEKAKKRADKAKKSRARKSAAAKKLAAAEKEAKSPKKAAKKPTAAKKDPAKKASEPKVNKAASKKK